MNDAILNEELLTDGEPLSADDLMRNLLQDLIADNGPDEVADEFVNEFVLRDREETAQILAALEMPSETLVQVLKGVVGQSYQMQIQALETRGVSYANELKNAVRERMTALADNSA